MKIKHLILGGITFILGATVVGTAIAQQLTNEQKTVICNLKTQVEQQKAKGNKLVFIPLLGKVRNQVETPFRAILHPNVDYIFIGVCDENCQDLNLVLKDLNGQVMTFSKNPEGIPIIAFTPTSEGEYQIIASPGNCSITEGCNFGMGIFAPLSATIPNASKIPSKLAQFQVCQ